MTRNSLTLTLVAAASLLAVANADIVFPMEARKQDTGLCGRISAGYSSKYISRGLAVEDSRADNLGDFEAHLRYDLPDNNAILVGGRYRWFSDNGTEHAKQPDKAALKAYVKEWLKNPRYREYALDEPMCDEATFTVQFAHHFTERTMIAAGYEFVHGGLPGRLHATDYEAKFDAVNNFITHGGTINDILGADEGSEAFNSNRAEEHSVVIDLHHSFDQELEGLFVDSRTRYVFQWERGWWFSNTLGYRYKLCDCADLIFTATWHATLGYFDADMANGNGTQGYTFSVFAPVNVTERLIITPHATCTVIGNGAKKGRNKIAGRFFEYNEYSILIGHEYDYENVAFDFGLSASYAF